MGLVFLLVLGIIDAFRDQVDQTIDRVLTVSILCAETPGLDNK